MTPDTHIPEGHRERLRQRFQHAPETLLDIERLELLLTYAIPRRDVAPLAKDLLDHFGSLPEIFAAPVSTLMNVEGIGESTAVFLQLIHHLMISPNSQAEVWSLDPMSPKQTSQTSPQLNLFELESKSAATKQPTAKERTMRVFANDEIANSLALLPKASGFTSFADFKQFLNEKLPYNAADTRIRRTSYILDRFYPASVLDIPLTFYAANCSAQDDLKPAIFYHILKAEPIAAKVAEELVWPALPLGRVEREQMREFILRYLPDAGASSQKNMLRSLFYTYDLLGVGSTNDTILRFQLHKGTLESFLYILTSEFPKPGMYSFDDLYAGPLHRWLLWDREWIRRQLYNLQDFGILSKVSEIDTVRQFSLALAQPAALRTYFEHPQRGQLAVREKNGQDFESLTRGE